MSEPVTVYLRSSQREALDRIGAQESRTLSNLLRKIIDDYLVEQGEKAVA